MNYINNYPDFNNKKILDKFLDDNSDNEKIMIPIFFYITLLSNLYYLPYFINIINLDYIIFLNLNFGLLGLIFIKKIDFSILTPFFIFCYYPLIFYYMNFWLIILNISLLVIFSLFILSKINLFKLIWDYCRKRSEVEFQKVIEILAFKAAFYSMLIMNYLLILLFIPPIYSSLLFLLSYFLFKSIFKSAFKNPTKMNININIMGALYFSVVIMQMVTFSVIMFNLIF